MGMATALDAASGLWFVYGGWSGGVDGGVGGFLSDLWSFDFDDSSWSLVQQPSDATEFPTPRQTDSRGRRRLLQRHTDRRLLYCLCLQC
jgi:hypothetical protein